MAQVSNSFPQSQSALGARFATLVHDIQACRARRKVFLTTLREMNTLSDRELSDLGLSRSEVRRIAWQAAYEV